MYMRQAIGQHGSPAYCCLDRVQSGKKLPERGSLSKEVLPSLNRRNQSNTCVGPIESSPYACCNNWYVSVAVFPISKQNSIPMRCSVLSHSVQIPMTLTHVLIPQPTAANWANAATCNWCHELLRHVRTCQDWLQTHPTQWTNTTIPIRIFFEQNSYILLPFSERLCFV